MLGKLQVHDPLDLQRLVPGTWGLEVLGTWELLNLGTHSQVSPRIRA